DEIYQLKTYYEVIEDLNLQDYRDGLEESNMDEAFAALKAQAKARQDNRGCTVKETKYRTHTYQKEDIDKTYVLDRSVEYSQILQEAEEQSIYGLARLESEDTKYITGVNDTINLSITENEVTEYSYDDYGNSEDIEEGFGYNGEHKDRSGLIYLRARYYNPRIGRFLQIDSYKGEDNALATKNRYTYVANNPYKYDDPSGHRSVKAPLKGNVVPKASLAKSLINIASKTRNAVLDTLIKTVKNTKVTNEQEVAQKAANLVKLTLNKISPVFQPQPCPRKLEWWEEAFIDFGNGFKDFTDGVVAGGEALIENSINGAIAFTEFTNDLMRDPLGTTGNVLSATWDTLKDPKFWVTAGKGAIVAITVSSGATLPVGIMAAYMASSASGEAYDYSVVHKFNFDSFLASRDCDTWQKYLGKEFVLINADGILGYLTGKEIEKFISSGTNTTKPSDKDLLDEVKTRPSWKKTETDVGNLYPGYSSQKSFLDGKEVPYGTKNSSRPDFYKNGHSVEVKNYNIESNNGINNLANNVSKQVNQRVKNLPEGTRQTIVIDVRCQKYTEETLKIIVDKINQKCIVDVEIEFLR
ncbi:MAG: RHS repeat-associated core domain-containing protein, partial [Erysipelotrichaceae bacterium]|nr:RHS repeat-associated core domain-containing protein [Erysipelotrichaceae bacterium]